MTRLSHTLLLALAFLLLRGVVATAAVPAGFQDTLVTNGLVQTSALAFAPDGRLLLVERSLGRVRVYKNGALLAQPFLTIGDLIPAGMYYDTYFERGFLGITFDPDFATNGWVYLYFSICKSTANPCTAAKNRLIRVRAVGDVADLASARIVLDDIDNDAGNHVGGWIEFGPHDGKLYVAVGDGGVPIKAQEMFYLPGKILRLNGDGTIPADNPFVGQPGKRGEIWAAGLRNPYRCKFAPDARLFCGDVGLNTWEELNVITRGANYGWPTTEGPFDPAAHPQLTPPIHAYHHNGQRACIIGGDFGSNTGFPGDHQQSYFFADFVLGKIVRARLDASGAAVQSVEDFATGIGDNGITNLVAGPDGSLYYTNYGTQQVRRITAIGGNASPVAHAATSPTSGQPPLTVQLSSAGSFDPDGDALTYRWSFGDGTPDATSPSPSHQYGAAGSYVATLTVSDGKPVPGPGTDSVTITVGAPPVPTITSPADGATFRAGDVIALAGSATDPDQGALGAASLRWEIVFHHDDHVHPFLDDLPGTTPSFATATTGETDPDVGYAIVLHATDATGITASTSVFILPELVDFTVTTEPPGLPLTFDGAPVSTPLTLTGVVGFERMIGAPSPVTSGGQTYWFSRWSDGGARTHGIDTPAGGGTFTARFLPFTCAEPFVIPAGGGSFELATGGTSALSGACAASNTSPEQVVRWTPSVSGTATIATCGGSTSYDTVLHVRSGSCSSGTTLACGDDSQGCTTTEPSQHHGSLLSLAVTAGETYFIVVDGYNGASGVVTLTVTPPGGPVPTATRTITPTPAVATPTRTATATRTATPSLTPSRTVTPTVTRTATPIQSATPLPATPTRTGTPLPARTATVVASPVSVCAAPTIVPAAGGVFTGTTSGASTQSATCAATGNAPEAAFQWTPTASGVATIATCGGTTSFDTVVFMRSGACQTGGIIGCADDATGCGTSEPSEHHASRLQAAVTAGQTYFIFVDGYNGSAGTFTLTITPPVTASPSPARTATPTPVATRTATATPPPTAIATVTAPPSATPTPIATRTATRTPTPAASAAAGTCASPIVIPPAGGTASGVTSGANLESGSCGVTDKGPEQVFAWTPAVSGPATIGTCGAATRYDTVVYLRRGACTGASEIGCSDDVMGCTTGEPNEYHGSRLTTVVTAGETYFIAVDGYNGAAGAFRLTVTAPNAPSPTATVAASPSVGPTSSLTASPTSSRTASPTSIQTPTRTVTATPPATATATAVPPSATRTSTPLPTATATAVATSTTTATATPTPTVTVTPPAGTCGNPIVVPPSGGTVSGVTSGSSAQFGTCGVSNKGPERVFMWTPTASGTAVIGTCGTATLYDTVLHMRGGTCGGAEIGCSDDVTGCATGEPSQYHGSRLTVSVTAGATYYLIVDGYNGAAGAFSLTVTAPGS